VWEVAQVVRNVSSRGDEAIQQTSELTDLSRAQVATVVRYYADFRDELDAWIQRVEEEAARAEAAWRRERDLLEV